MNNNSNSNNSNHSVSSEDSTDVLSCKQERIDLSSPELWPEAIPGVTHFTAAALKKSHADEASTTCNSQQESNEVTSADVNAMQELSNLTVQQISARFQELKNQVYQLGVEESREMARGKYLNILGKS